MAEEPIPPAVMRWLREKGRKLGKEYGQLNLAAYNANVSFKKRSRNAREAGKQSGKNMTPEERKERARQAAAARWEKKRREEAGGS